MKLLLEKKIFYTKCISTETTNQEKKFGKRNLKIGYFSNNNY